MSGLPPDIFLSFATGLVCGLLSSAPLGSINLWLIGRFVNAAPKRTGIICFLSGVVMIDLSFATLAVWGHHALVTGSAAGSWIAGIGGCFLILLGMQTLLRQRSETTVPQMPRAESSAVRQWLLGAFMCGSNPGFLLFWIYVVDQLRKHVFLTGSGPEFWSFLAGIAVGDFLWFGLLISGVRRFRSMVSGKSALLLNHALAAAFIFLGAVGIIKIL